MPGGLLWTGNNGRIGTQFDVANNTGLANIPGMVFQLSSEQTKALSFRAVLFISCGATGGYKIGTALNTISASQISILLKTFKATALQDYSLMTSFTSFGNAGTTALVAELEGSFKMTNSAFGTFAIQFAQNVSNGTNSSILVGSFCNLFPHF